MTEYRHFALWARTFAGFVALAGLLGLGGCGGGSGAPNNVFNSPGALSIQPNPLTVYAGTPATVTIAGGNGPFQVFSSDSSALPVISVSGNTVTVLPNNVGAATPVTLTVRDALGNTATTAVTVQPSTFIGGLKLKADSFAAGCPNPTGSANPTDEIVSTFVCSGQTASLSIHAGNGLGSGAGGRLVRFDIVQGAFQIFTELPGQPPTFALTYTVPTDANGNAVVRIRAIPGAPQQTAIVQATDVATGAFVRGTFVIIAISGGNPADLVVLPDEVTITGPDNQTCSSGVSSTYFIFGGQPPYTIVNAFPQALLVSPSIVTNAGAGFTVTTLGACVEDATFVITDAAGHSITATLTNQLGTAAPPTNTTPNPIAVTPSSIPLLTCGASTNVVATGGGTVATTGNQQVTTPASAFFVGVSRPDLLAATPTNPAAGAPITLTRQPGTPAQGTATVNVSLFISDGGQTRTINVPVTGAACP